jgi:hypothetical protein
MRRGITIEVSAADRARLETVIADRNSPQKHVWRAGIILATADSFGIAEIMRRTGKSIRTSTLSTSSCTIRACSAGNNSSHSGCKGSRFKICPMHPPCLQVSKFLSPVLHADV